MDDPQEDADHDDMSGLLGVEGSAILEEELKRVAEAGETAELEYRESLKEYEWFPGVERFMMTAVEAANSVSNPNFKGMAERLGVSQVTEVSEVFALIKAKATIQPLPDVVAFSKKVPAYLTETTPPLEEAKQKGGKKGRREVKFENTEDENAMGAQMEPSVSSSKARKVVSAKATNAGDAKAAFSTVTSADKHRDMHNAALAARTETSSKKGMQKAQTEIDEDDDELFRSSKTRGAAPKRKLMLTSEEQANMKGGADKGGGRGPIFLEDSGEE